MPLITLPTRITSQSKTLIDNIWTNRYEKEIIAGNITVGISDHIPQFTLIPETNYKQKKARVAMKQNLKNMNKEAFCRDLSEIDCDFASSERPSNSLEKLLSNVEKLLNKYAPYKKNNSERSKNRNKALDYKRYTELIST